MTGPPHPPWTTAEALTRPARAPTPARRPSRSPRPLRRPHLAKTPAAAADHDKALLSGVPLVQPLQNRLGRFRRLFLLDPMAAVQTDHFDIRHERRQVCRFLDRIPVA